MNQKLQFLLRVSLNRMFVAIEVFKYNKVNMALAKPGQDSKIHLDFNKAYTKFHGCYPSENTKTDMKMNTNMKMAVVNKGIFLGMTISSILIVLLKLWA